MLIKLLVSNNMDGILEAVRVFGNLSQHHDICDFIVQKNGELMALNVHKHVLLANKQLSSFRAWVMTM